MNNLKIFYIDIKPLNLLKKRLYFEERWQISRVNNLKAIRIENTPFTKFCLYMCICVWGSTKLWFDVLFELEAIRKSD